MLRDVWYRYPGSKNWVLRGVNLEVHEEQVIGVVGPNGAGKTTLLKVAGLLYRPLRGRVLIDRVDYWSAERQVKLAARRLVAYVHPEPVLVRGSVLDNLVLSLVMRGVKKQEAILRVKMLAEKLGIRNLLYRKASSLSSGEAQLISILRAIIASPRYLLLDEPTSHLDSSKKALLADILAELVKYGSSVVIATHDTGFLSKLGARIVEIVDGRIVGSGGAHHSPRAA
ncbi:energy-coupling factor ABC transporter ATP-binding protein [Pyrolobus fumarii]|uniref:energy-coupling factor ABC transporter ATP-binding protein n=1 Tax=Pyrolobus fumarii TaxID=54252 RepID=UPI001FCCA746|nr:ABC transporter ATP-binding protein [Pyrolobus fumarii]